MNNVCGICGVKNIVEVNVFTESETNDFVKKVFDGEINTEKLDVNLYNKSSELMVKYFNEGYGDGEKNEDYDEMIENIYVFNAAKQYQAVSEISSIDKSVKETFLTEATKVFNKYYSRFFTVELDTCDATGIAVKKWFEFKDAEG